MQIRSGNRTIQVITSESTHLLGNDSKWSPVSFHILNFIIFQFFLFFSFFLENLYRISVFNLIIFILSISAYTFKVKHFILKIKINMLKMNRKIYNFQISAKKRTGTCHPVRFKVIPCLRVFRRLSLLRCNVSREKEKMRRPYIL